MSASMGCVAPDPNSAGPSTDDEARLAEYAHELAGGIEAAIGPWVERVVRTRLEQAGMTPSAEVGAAIEAAMAEATAEVGGEVRALLEQDIDDQSTNPLHLVRSAVRYPTEVLRSAVVPPVERDADAERLFPDDPYDLTPGSFADLDPELADVGMRWGAAKAYVHLARRRAEGRR
jgi:hypothetical protein